jgi:hypothetical protein
LKEQEILAYLSQQGKNHIFSFGKHGSIKLTSEKKRKILGRVESNCSTAAALVSAKPLKALPPSVG